MCYTHWNYDNDGNRKCEHVCMACAGGDCEVEQVPVNGSVHFETLAQGACCMKPGKLSCIGDDECGPTRPKPENDFAADEGGIGFCAS